MLSVEPMHLGILRCQYSLVAVPERLKVTTMALASLPGRSNSTSSRAKRICQLL